MMQKPNNIAASDELNNVMASQFESAEGLRVISLSTTDGFDICTVKDSAFTVEPDKLAAVSSTFSALGNTSVKNMTNGEYLGTILEGDNGSVLLMITQYLNVDAVLMFVAKHKMTLGELRFIARRLAFSIAELN